ncbi:hypothetical protein ABL78_7717 [Leptomonas seymouri]|uniref:Uncharacterized protein n=1 Tax=Leptomonas seymouri TaxID=5684 RepID=A0A0N0P2R4_LEPSE|nr:hypothetical protein ABL78_7717 [Leptomonas seymouri]|eukprot:KPI83259.1 hypothetical protein ABL78_7717 [Leptomonas seymouri]
MSDAEVDAYVTVRRLLVQLLQAQHVGKQRAEGRPITSDFKADRARLLRLPAPDTAASAPDSSNPLSREAFAQYSEKTVESSLHTNSAGACAGVAAPRATDTIASSCAPPGILLPRADEAWARPKPFCNASASTKRGWRRRRHGQLPSFFSFRSSSPSTKSCSNTACEEVEGTAALGLAPDDAEDGVRRWKASINDTLRQQGGAFEKLLRALLKTHVQTALTATIMTSGAQPAMDLSNSGTIRLRPPPPMPSIKSAAPPSVVNESSVEATRDRSAEPTALANPQAASSNEPGSTVASSDFALGFPMHLQVVAAGYAATICLQTQDNESADPGVQEGENLSDCAPQSPCLRAQESATGCDAKALKRWNATTKEGHRSDASANRKTQSAPLTLREQLCECVVQAKGKRIAPLLPSSKECNVSFSHERVASLLSQLHLVQRAALREQALSENFADAAGHPLPPCPLLSLTAMRGGHATSELHSALTQCTVWEYSPLRISPAQRALFSSVQTERGSNDRHGRSKSKGPKATSMAVARLKSAWRGHLHRLRKTSNINSSDTKENLDGAHSTLGQRRSSSLLQRGLSYTADPLCMMSDGEWGAIQASITATQTLLVHISKTLQHSDTRAPQLCAYSPLDTLLKASAYPREQIVVSYSLPPCALDAVRWLSTPEKPSPALSLHTAWVVCVEVDAVHAAWLRRMLLDVAATPLPARHGAGVGVGELRADVLASLHLLDHALF